MIPFRKTGFSGNRIIFGYAQGQQRLGRDIEHPFQDTGDPIQQSAALREERNRHVEIAQQEQDHPGFGELFVCFGQFRFECKGSRGEDQDRVDAPEQKDIREGNAGQTARRAEGYGGERQDGVAFEGLFFVAPDIEKVHDEETDHPELGRRSEQKQRVRYQRKKKSPDQKFGVARIKGMFVYGKRHEKAQGDAGVFEHRTGKKIYKARIQSDQRRINCGQYAQQNNDMFVFEQETIHTAPPFAAFKIQYILLYKPCAF
jgi:hypothetical protein